MIVKLSGKLEYVGTDCVHVTLGGGGDLTHELLVPAADIPLLQTKLGQNVTFFTVEYLEGNASFGQLAPKMLGFLRVQDREFFDLFTTVKGIGTRKALRALAIPTGDIARAIALKDTRKLATLPTVGKRAAETIIAELHGKVDRFSTGRGRRNRRSCRIAARFPANRHRSPGQTRRAPARCRELGEARLPD